MFQESGPKATMYLAYLNSNAVSPLMDKPFSSFPTIKRHDLTSLYHLYIGRVRTGVSRIPSDVNGYPLIPFYDTAPISRLDSKHKSRIDAHGWLDTTEFSIQHVVNSIGTTLYTNFANPHSADFASQWTAGKIVGSFTYETSNFLANCSHKSLLNLARYPGLLPVMTLSINMTVATNTTSKDKARTFTVWEQYSITHSLQATCNLTEIHTDVRVNCTPEGCKVGAIRPSPNITYPRLRTPSDDSAFANDFFNSLLLADGEPESQSDMTMLEADNGREPLKAQLNADQAANRSFNPDLDTDAYALSLSRGLTNHINTFYSAAMYMKYECVNELQLMRTPYFAINASDTNFTILEVDGTEVNLRYELSIPWVTVDIISNLILLTAIIFSFWLRRNTLAPDVFGYVSSLTRDNPHIQLPVGGSTLSGLQRSRRMKHWKVKLGDAGDGMVGRVVMIGDWDAGKIERIKRLEKSKTYA